MGYQENPDKWGLYLLAIMLLVVGILIIVFPDAFADFQTSGRRAFRAMIIRALWSYPVAVIALLGSVYAGWRGFKS